MTHIRVLADFMLQQLDVVRSTVCHHRYYTQNSDPYCQNPRPSRTAVGVTPPTRWFWLVLDQLRLRQTAAGKHLGETRPWFWHTISSCSWKLTRVWPRIRTRTSRGQAGSTLILDRIIGSALCWTWRVWIRDETETRSWSQICSSGTGSVRSPGSGGREWYQNWMKLDSD